MKKRLKSFFGGLVCIALLTVYASASSNVRDGGYKIQPGDDSFSNMKKPTLAEVSPVSDDEIKQNIINEKSDLNDDGKVNWQDKRMLRDFQSKMPAAYNATPDSKNWDANMDLNDDGKISWQDKRILRDFKNQISNDYGKDIPKSQTSIKQSILDGKTDLNDDGKVNWQDKRMLRDFQSKMPAAYNATPDSKNWDANMDLNNDGKISWQDKRILRDFKNQMSNDYGIKIEQ